MEKKRSTRRAAGIAAVALFLLLSGCAPQAAAPAQTPQAAALPAGPDEIVAPLTAQQMREDLDCLCDTLEKKHKNLYHAVSREEFQAARQALAEAVDAGMGAEAFYFGLMRLVAMAGDSHTYLGSDQQRWGNLHVVPLQLMRFAEGWVVAAAPEAHAALLGGRVRALNGLPIEEAAARLAPYIGHDNEAWLAQSMGNYLIHWDILHDAGLAPQQEVVYTVECDGEEVEAEVTALRNEDVQSLAFATLSYQPAATAPEGYYRSMALDEATYFIQYNTCAEDPAHSMREFAREVEQALEEGAYARAIVDLRYNGGGNSAILEPLIQGLGKYAGQGGRVYTLISGNTFSSALMNAVQLKERAGAVLVGEASGGSVNHYGELQSFTLPNLNVSVVYSTKYFEQISGYAGTSLLPDIPVTHTLADFIAGVDADVEAVRAQQ